MKPYQILMTQNHEVVATELKKGAMKHHKVPRVKVSLSMNIGLKTLEINTFPLDSLIVVEYNVKSKKREADPETGVERLDGSRGRPQLRSGSHCD
uniref:Uncharacterized protein n=1 Tax=Pelusios castaneus TaxID=367368 RepID=A0A8C8VN27_9SAUR